MVFVTLSKLTQEQTEKIRMSLSASSSLISSSLSSSIISLASVVNVVTLTLTVILSSAHNVQGFHTGGPNYSCRNLIPGHSNGTQVGPPPYSLTVSSPVLTPGGSTTVTLQSTGDFPFKGFLCAVSTLEDLDNNSVGTVSRSSSLPSSLSSSNIAPIQCSRSSPNTAMTHTNSEDKYRVDFDWTAPSTASVGQQFKLRCTCVMNFFRCWTDLRVDLVIGSSTPSLSEAETPAGSSTTGSNDGGDRSSALVPNNNRNGNSNNGNNESSGVSGSSFDLDFGVRNNLPSSFPLRPQNNRPNSVSNSPSLSNTDSNTNSIINDPTLRIGSAPALDESSIPASPLIGGSVLPLSNIPVRLTNNIPNQLTDNHIVLPLDPNVEFVPLPLNNNIVNPSSSGFVLNSFVSQNQVGSDRAVGSIGGRGRLNQDVGSFTAVNNARGNFGGLSSSLPNNNLRLRSRDLSRSSSSQNPQAGLSRGPVANGGRSLTRNRPNRNTSRIGASSSSLQREPLPSRSRIPSNRNLVDQNHVRGAELFTNPQETVVGRGDFGFPTRFFLTPGALLRFLERNSL